MHIFIYISFLLGLLCAEPNWDNVEKESVELFREYLQIDTTNVLFIVGGAFDGLDQIISKRLGENTIGFNTTISDVKDYKKEELFKFVEPKDLIKYGLIPEFIGRLPIATSVNELDKEALI